jgi:DNA-binding NarL/FixJ family response regulator
MINIIITDDHKIVRDGIKSLLQDDSQLNIVGEASNGQELIQLLSDQEAQVVLMDLKMPTMDGFSTTQYLKEHFPQVRVLALSMLDDENYVRQMLEAGALGYIPKTSNKEELIFAIKTVAAGQKFICSEMACRFLENIPKEQPKKTPLNSLESLSKCEMSVLKLIAEGYTNNEIAEKLFNSKRTIESHRQSLLLKTQCKNTASLVKYALIYHII